MALTWLQQMPLLLSTPSWQQFPLMSKMPVHAGEISQYCPR